MLEIKLSQLVGVISATWETKRIRTLTNPYLNWEDEYKTGRIPAKEGSYKISASLGIAWNNKGIHPKFGDQAFYIHFNEVRVRRSGGYFYATPVGTAYLYDGDNCNSDTQFLYFLIGNGIKIWDDYGLVGNFKRVMSNKSLCNYSPSALEQERLGKNFWELYTDDASGKKEGGANGNRSEE